MTQLTNKEDIKIWLDNMKIKNYIINSDLTIDVNEDVSLQNKNLSSLPIQFGEVGGSFYIFKNNLTSLKGTPYIVNNIFDCSNNQLTSLLDGPQKVKQGYICTHNQLTSLEGVAQNIGDILNIQSNHITTLKNIKTNIVFAFIVVNNPLEKIDYESIKDIKADCFYIDNVQKENFPSFEKFNPPGNCLLDFKKVKDYLKVESEKIALEKKLIQIDKTYSKIKL